MLGNKDVILNSTQALWQFLFQAPMLVFGPIITIGTNKSNLLTVNRSSASVTGYSTPHPGVLC